MEKPTLEELEKLAKETKIPLGKFKDAFDIPEECPVITIEEAKADYYTKRGTAQQTALLIWIQLCTTIKQVEEVYSKTYSHTKGERAALRKMYEIWVAA